MATPPIEASENIVIWINDDGGSDAGNEMRVEHLTTHVVLLQIKEPGEVVVTGTILRDGVHELHNTFSGTGTIASFLKNGTNYLDILYDATEGETILRTPAGLDTDLSIQSAADVVVILDHDNDSGSNALRLRNSSGDDIIVFQDDGQMFMYESGTAQIQLSFSGGDTFLDVGLASDTRGHIHAAADLSSGATRAGVLRFQDKSGDYHYVWASTSNVLRIGTSDPGTNDGAGGAVGQQS